MKAVLFDLDGTLADTAPDLGHALNLQRERHGLPPLPQETIRPYASHGTVGLFDIGFGLTPQDERFAPMREEYLALYTANLCLHTTLFPGMAELLAALEARNISWGVVTNKPARFTNPLLELLGLSKRAASIISGDTCAHPKPHPEPLLRAAREIGVAPQSCLYVGDAERDIEAARAAGMAALIADYGYLGAEDRPETWGADGRIDTPLGILAFLP
ncbi:2-phosphoglycolate phosphatase [Sulfuricella denitrificans skB26]|uniref:phosphoglycolate phosphatase n=1 Tax=Sulfuricella denitrificans (strain DSM 22764 / NBRC 105220 / skB26) TaxID=1163617 RepID=S6AFY5_SULDS|nr:2-phosphoglycolate phosphatase [Sulfuricella denitrificans skB26]